jgi:hypothetical protein
MLVLGGVMSVPESPGLILREVLDLMPFLPPEKRAEYERRMARAVWLDRAEVLEAAKGEKHGS